MEKPLETDDFARAYVARYQLVAIACGAAYGVLALAGLIATHIAMSTAWTPLGALLACAAALCAYLNFSLASSDSDSHWLDRTRILSILLGAGSGVLVIVSAAG